MKIYLNHALFFNPLYPTAIKVTTHVIAGLTRNLQQINGIAGQARNDAVSKYDSSLV